MKRSITAIPLLLGTVLLWGLEEGERPIMDHIYLTDAKRITARVLHEYLDALYYRHVAGKTEKKLTWGLVKKVVYDGMDTGYYKAAMDLRRAANFDAAADHFMHLATAGTREWEGTRGFYHAGECFEKAGKYERSASVFATFCAKYPKHPWWMNGKYYEGINQARQEKVAEATAIAEMLIAYGKENKLHVGRKGEMRANAIKAVVLAVQGDMEEAMRIAKRARFGRGEEAIGYHWENFWAYFLLEKKRFDSATMAFRDLLKNAAGDPMREAESSVGYGIALAQAGDLNGALMQFLKLDVLPYGTPQQRCLAQYWAARCLWKLAEANQASEEKIQQKLAVTQKEQCKLLLRSCLANPVSIKERDKAQLLLDQWFPPVVEEKAEGEEPAAVKAPALGAP